MDRKKIIYIGIIFIITVISSITYFSYGFLTSKNEYHGRVNMVVGTLDYELKSNDLDSNNSISVPKGKTQIEITIKSLNIIDSKYELYYETDSSDIEVGYSSNTVNSVSEIITSNDEKKITVVINNTSNTNQVVTFGVQGGFTYNSITLLQGNNIDQVLNMCQYNPGDVVKEAGYTGAEDPFIVPCDGNYKLEVWGASGGNASHSNGGKGGYSYGTVSLEAEEILYVYVGEAGSRLSAAGCGNTSFNGGGRGCAVSYYGTVAASGGGGTDIRINSNSLYARVIVAGGGGGGQVYGSSITGNTGYGGGINGQDGTYERTSSVYAKGGTQTSGGAGGTFSPGGYPYAESGSFGQGGSGLDHASNGYNLGSGGGGGWYGGGGGGHASGAGGSGYVYTSLTASNYPSGCLLNSSYYLTDANTINGGTSFKSPTGTNETGHSGHGYARITYLGD